MRRDWSSFTLTLRFNAILALFALASMDWTTHQQATPIADQPLANEMPIGTSSSSDERLTFAYD
jgi:hypothetical protein